MGFISDSQATEEQERVLINEFWGFVHGEDMEGVSDDTIAVALLTLIGVHLSDREGVPDKQEEE